MVSKLQLYEILIYKLTYLKEISKEVLIKSFVSTGLTLNSDSNEDNKMSHRLQAIVGDRMNEINELSSEEQDEDMMDIDVYDDTDDDMMNVDENEDMDMTDNECYSKYAKHSTSIKILLHCSLNITSLLKLIHTLEYYD